MPAWVTGAVAIVQVLLVGEAVAALTFLAARGVIDGGAAIAAILATTGVGGGASIATHAVARRSTPTDAQPAKDGSTNVG